MNAAKKPPKKAESKTSCLRITVPENLDLALEGLIRKVLKEQPKMDDIHTFAADYFDTLLRIRDRAGVKYTSAQLCPFHDDEDAHEMIKLAKSFERSGKRRSREGGLRGERKGGREVGSGKRGTLRGGEKRRLGKEATRDSMKKVSVSGSGEKGMREEKNEEEEELKGDPIKELVEKELMMKTETEKMERETVIQAKRSKGGVKAEKEELGEGKEIKEETEGSDKEAAEGRIGEVEEVKRALGVEGTDRVSTRDDGRENEKEETDGEKIEGKAHAEEEVQLLVENKLPTAEQEKEEGEKVISETVKDDAGHDKTGTETGPKEEKNEKPEEPETELQELEEKSESAVAAEESREKNDEEPRLRINDAEDARSDTESQNREMAVVEGTKTASEDTEEGEKQLEPTADFKIERKQQETEDEVPSDGGIKENEEIEIPKEQKTGATESIKSTPTAVEEDGRENMVEKSGEDKTTVQPLHQKERTTAGDVAGIVDDSGVESTAPETLNADEELCTVVDIQQIPAVGEVTLQKEQPAGPEESAEVIGQHVIRVEGAESANDSQQASQQQEEMQVKTIQTHYYDTLQVPERVTKELRVHNVTGKGSEGVELGESSSSSSGTREEAGPTVEEEEREVPIVVEGLSQQGSEGSESQRSESDELKGLTTPSSGYSMNLSEVSWQTVSGMFIESERQHSSSVWEELRQKRESGEEKEERVEGRQEIEEVFQKTVVPSRLGAVPTPPRDAEEIKEEESGGILEKVEEKEVKEERGEDVKEGERKGEVMRRSEGMEEEKKKIDEADETDDEIKKGDEGVKENEEKKEEMIENEVEVADMKEDEKKGEERGKEEEEEEKKKGEEQKEREKKKEEHGEGVEEDARENEEKEDAKKQEEMDKELEVDKKKREEKREGIQEYDEKKKEEKGEGVEKDKKEEEKGKELEKDIMKNEEKGEGVEEDEKKKEEKNESLEEDFKMKEERGEGVEEDEKKEEKIENLEEDVKKEEKSEEAKEVKKEEKREEVEEVKKEEKREEAEEVKKEEKREEAEEVKKEEKREEAEEVKKEEKSEEAEEVKKEEKREEVEEIKMKEKKGKDLEEDEKEKEENPGGESSESSSNGKSIDSDTPFISVEVRTIIQTQVLDEDEGKDTHPQLELTLETTIDVEDAEDTRGQSEEPSGGEEKQMSDGQKTGDGSGQSGGGGREGTERKEGSSGESESTVSSAATEIKRSELGRRKLESARSLLTSQSLDLGGRNPLLRTRSLSTFRHGVTDFEVWSAIEKELEEAATKIQSRFRRYKTRKKLQRENAVQITTEESSASTTPVEPDERQQSTGEFHDSVVLSEHPR